MIRGLAATQSTLARQFPFQNWHFFAKLSASIQSVKETLYLSFCFYAHLQCNTWLGVYSLTCDYDVIFEFLQCQAPELPVQLWTPHTKRHLCLKVEISCCSGKTFKFPQEKVFPHFFFPFAPQHIVKIQRNPGHFSLQLYKESS